MSDVDIYFIFLFLFFVYYFVVCLLPYFYANTFSLILFCVVSVC